jgi:hypothetical protein
LYGAGRISTNVQPPREARGREVEERDQSAIVTNGGPPEQILLEWLGNRMTKPKNELNPLYDRITSLLENVGTLETTAPALLEYLGKAFQCAWIALWQVIPGDSLRVLSMWQPETLRAAAFNDFTVRWQPDPGEGMVGKAWRSSRPQVSVNVVQDMVLPRSLHASGAGITSGLWFPIRRRAGGFVLESLWCSKPELPVTVLIEQFADRITEFFDRKKPRRNR